MDLIRTLTNAQMKSDLPEIKTGDTVKVSAKVVEGNRERIQVFEGTVMRLRGGGLGLNITVRRIASGVGVERTFKVHSPRIEKIEVVRHGVSNRAQLYFLRDRVGKQSSLRERRRRCPRRRRRNRPPHRHHAHAATGRAQRSRARRIPE